jgi:uncharacterized protein (DUF362 family)
MSRPFSRRSLLTGAAAAVAGKALWPHAADAQTIPPYAPTPTVALVSGNDRALNIYHALQAIDGQIQPILRTKTSVLIKPNVVVSNTPQVPACTHPDALRGILEYLAGSGFRGPVVIAEAGANYTTAGFATYGYPAVVNEYRASFSSLGLIDLNEEGLYLVQTVVDQDLHVQPIRVAARLFDPNAFIISASIMKTHDRVVATMSVKNMAMGAPLHATNAEGWWTWSDKPRMHDTYRLANVNIYQMARELKRYWGVAVIDGFEGMEGNGPTSGTAVPSRVAIASTDFLAADRVGVECMGINPDWVGYLNYAWKLGLGQYDLDRINLAGGVSPASVKRTYRLHDQVGAELEWLDAFPNCNANLFCAPRIPAATNPAHTGHR